MIDRNKGKALTIKQAAAELGLIYIKLQEQSAVPLGTEALPQYQAGSPFNAALGKVYGSDFARDTLHLKTGEPYWSRNLLYSNDFNTVIPIMREAALAFAKETIEYEMSNLDNIVKDLKNKPIISDNLHKVAKSIGEKVGGYKLTDSENMNYMLNKEHETYAISQMERRMLLKEQDRLIRKRVGLEVSKEKDILLKVLFTHPKGVSILAAYSESPNNGINFVVPIIQDCIKALKEFGEKIQENNHVMRYPILVVGGVKKLKLEDVPGFTQYAIEISQVLSQDKLASKLDYIGWVLFCIGIVFVGPASVLVLGTLQLALTGAGTTLSFLRELEQDLGAQASHFRSEDEYFTHDTNYAETAIYGATLLISAFAILQQGKSIRQVLNSKANEVKDIPLANISTNPNTRVGSKLSKVEEDINQVLPEKDMLLKKRGTTQTNTGKVIPVDRKYQAPEIIGNPDPRTARTGGIQRIEQVITKDNVTEITIEGVILEMPGPRKTWAPNFNEKEAPASLFGLQDYDRAHLWGPRFGDEAAAGIMYAPQNFNKSMQSIVEIRIQEFQRMAQARGGEVWVTAKATSHDRSLFGGNCLAKVEYRIKLKGNTGLPIKEEQISISIGLPPKGRVFDAEILQISK